MMTIGSKWSHLGNLTLKAVKVVAYMFEIQHRPIFVRCYLVLVIIKALYTHMAITTPGFGPAIHCHFHLRPTVNRPDKTFRN